ncbi:hypothetical protein NDU88_004137 [Pleurodeles waltl]|uniref:Uncharacterized protein n=1 Tax=Pleurodeles waltl TaxID=8319 RepID=A0AAV7QF26_PLEWA|nr:hypothetical protein NDU88_004137 [Pleurodeles waltl]
MSRRRLWWDIKYGTGAPEGLAVKKQLDGLALSEQQWRGRPLTIKQCITDWFSGHEQRGRQRQWMGLRGQQLLHALSVGSCPVNLLLSMTALLVCIH